MMLAPTLASADQARDWLTRIQMATHKTSYLGTFVYRQGDQMEVMRIAHRVNQDGIQERLSSQNGWAREIIRKNDEVICYLPDKKAAMAGHRAPSKVRQQFPTLLPGTIDGLGDSYQIRADKAERIAGYKTMLVMITPRDNYRYGYRLWADRQTGLLLKSDLLDESGKIIEQFMFSDVRIGGPISDQDLEPALEGKGLAWHRVEKQVADSSMDTDWQVSDLPPGYRVTEKMVRNVPGKPAPVTHLLISDGLASVSVFIEKAVKGAQSDKMVTGMGAAHAYRASLDGHQLTVVGEVPATTVERIGRSVSHK